MVVVVLVVVVFATLLLVVVETEFRLSRMRARVQRRGWAQVPNGVRRMYVLINMCVCRYGGDKPFTDDAPVTRAEGAPQVASSLRFPRRPTCVRACVHFSNLHAPPPQLRAAIAFTCRAPVCSVPAHRRRLARCWWSLRTRHVIMQLPTPHGGRYHDRRLVGAVRRRGTAARE